ncbi:MAG TPA: Lrp/AsnC ligand binding domain-containing protein [Nitrososphaera sp.]|jgi:DNA-binding Lrp family transcriptional regulator|nr:Lrp/AsnC ligand binding domain-containing protein [Nitrososphaera sp.]
MVVKTKAFVLINTDAGLEKLVHEEIKSLEGVQAVYDLYGEYDLMAIVEQDTDKDVAEVVSWELRKIKGIRSTNTMVVAK